MKRHAKLRAVACRFWGITPNEFDRQCEAGEITYSDVTDLIAVIAHDPTQMLLIQWLFPEAEERRKKQEVINKHEAALERALAHMTPQKVTKDER